MRQRSEDHAGVNLAVALKRRARMSVGNLIGSNIFDTLIPVGVAAVIVDLEFNADMLRHELPFLFALYLGYAMTEIVSL